MTGIEQSVIGPRVVVVHDYLTQRGGAERVVLQILRAFPGAHLVTSVYEPEQTYPEFAEFEITTTWLNRVSWLRRDPRRALPFLAGAFSRLDLTGAELVICSSSGWSHGVRTGAPKVVYCHNPARWLYQTEDYLRDQPWPVRVALSAIRPLLRRWDRRAAAGATTYLANSSLVRDRIRNTYGIEADVLHPPVGLQPGGAHEPIPGLEPGFLLSVSRARGYKNAEAILHAVQDSDGERVVLVGGLPPPPPGTEWSPRLIGLHDVSDAQLRWLYANCDALLAIGHEDFGLTPLEANGFGKPVVCLCSGGYLDTVRPGVTGVFIEEPTADALVEGIRTFRSLTLDPEEIRRHADLFGPAAFAVHLRAISEHVIDLRDAESRAATLV